MDIAMSAPAFYVLYFIVLGVLSALWFSFYRTNNKQTNDDHPKEDESKKDEPEQTPYKETWHDICLITFETMTLDMVSAMDMDEDLFSTMKHLHKRLSQRRHDTRSIEDTPANRPMVGFEVKLRDEFYHLSLSVNPLDPTMFILLMRCHQNPNYHHQRLVDDTLDALRFLPLENITTYPENCISGQLGMDTKSWFESAGEDGSFV